ncbi:Protein-lysine methyltransferase METTL21B [Porphyridium purpureum]|uniref:Protein-lysine methyltransferase METTL21B n=1 Tax=Porphyridium purpureum TaxID=35688 RepID=A0A5J4Z297_PORPP|nr:Protein-lysine methyltransferase METTL21B [Porphyridium purpureum]|eukprot:POR3834..scf208_2
MTVGTMRVIQVEVEGIDRQNDAPQVLHLHEDMELADNETGATIWDGCLVAVAWMKKQQVQYMWRSSVVLELGAGTGAAGLVLAALGARVVLTDLPHLVPLMEKNVRANQAAFVYPPRVCALPWSAPANECSFDAAAVKSALIRAMGSETAGSSLYAPTRCYILAVEIIYLESTFSDLIATLNWTWEIMFKPEQQQERAVEKLDVKLIIAAELRVTVPEFFRQFHAAGWKHSFTPPEEYDDLYRSDDIRILLAWRDMS